MEKKVQQKYLGDIISADGKNTLNFKSRNSRAYSIISELSENIISDAFVEG